MYAIYVIPLRFLACQIVCMKAACITMVIHSGLRILAANVGVITARSHVDKNHVRRCLVYKQSQPLGSVVQCAKVMIGLSLRFVERIALIRFLFGMWHY